MTSFFLFILCPFFLQKESLYFTELLTCISKENKLAKSKSEMTIFGQNFQYCIMDHWAGGHFKGAIASSYASSSQVIVHYYIEIHYKMLSLPSPTPSTGHHVPLTTND